MAVQRKKFEGIKAVTPTFRASYLTVFEPRAFEDGPEKYSVEMLFHKTKTDLTELKKKMHSVAVLAWGKDKAKWPKNFRWPFKDGDEKEDAGEVYLNHVYLRADSQQPVGIFDQEKNDIIDKREIFSGCFCRASVFMVPYENIGGKGAEGRSGIKVYLVGVQLVKKGEPLGNNGGKNDFDTIENDDADDTESDDDAGF